jgi:DNA-binding response OmpR family regulator
MNNRGNTGHTVLVADDDEGYRFPISSMLRDFGYNVCEADDVNGLREHASNADIWVVDVRLPERLEGIDAVETLRTEGMKPKFGVIFISVLSESDCGAHLKYLPRVEYRWIEKPFELEYLLNTINNMIQG